VSPHHSPQNQIPPCKVGYGNPPRHAIPQGPVRQSGRPLRDPGRRLKALTLQEIYRATAVKEDGRILPTSSIEAIRRSQVELAAKGNVQAQRAILATIRRFEKEDEEAAKVAAIRLGIYGRVSGTGPSEHEPDARELGVEELDAAEETGDGAQSASPDAQPEFPVPDHEFPVPHGTGNSAEPVDR
jgi:Family of unknown function (DUF5681)